MHAYAEQVERGQGAPEKRHGLSTGDCQASHSLDATAGADGRQGRQSFPDSLCRLMAFDDMANC